MIRNGIQRIRYCGSTINILEEFMTNKIKQIDA